MPTNVGIQVPFIPQEGITQQILAAIQLANIHNQQQRELGLRQQALQQQAPLIQAQTGLAGAQAGVAGATQRDIEQQVQQRQVQLDIYRRQLGYVFGAGDQSGTQPGQTPQAPQAGPVEQKGGLMADLQETKSRLKLNPEESAAFDQAAKTVQTNFLSTQKLDMSPVDKVIAQHLEAEGKRDTTLHPTLRMAGGQWYQDMHTADGTLAYSNPIPPPADYLSKRTEGVDYLKSVNQQTGETTITPITTERVTTPILPGQNANPPKTTGGGAGKGNQPFVLQGGGRKLSEAGQGLVTGLTNATDLTQPAMDFLSGPNKPSNADWYKAVAMYKLHMDPGPGFAQAFQAIGMARAIATGPLLHGIRNQSIIKGIQEHLPDVTDSPALALQKMKDLQPFWKQAIEEVYKTEGAKPPTSSVPSFSQWQQEQNH